MKRVRIRVVSPWFGSLETEEASFSSAYAAEDADALLCDWAPSPELFEFPRRKAWYCCEPWAQFKALEKGTWPRLRSRLKNEEVLYHNHPDLRYRVPHVTHFEQLAVARRPERIEKAVAVVSNFGGGPWRRDRDMAYRNTFVINPRVDLFGRSGWNAYRPTLFSKAAAPLNYRGELPGDWPASEKRDLMSRYKVSVCLENVSEPGYFTEKFVEAVCAGCIPIYRPDEQTSQGILRGAFWVDPRHYDSNPENTIDAALALNLEAVQEQNLTWIRDNEMLRSTSQYAVFRRIGLILSE